ncbi:hypothetical protein K491DRAFT_688348 [Lophiostoma macrostomum CBS 122681]|uniref:Uncharacterized protein n=1 Tax=Lophiostoma macrostomum CBS 122681 TaxID=1314788 RepID=A0A6A6TJW2_9PLEO|nr:hypothetical protein K491DRAFT_688348 [Lophiostoma macrostomum CBS 122681]
MDEGTARHPPPPSSEYRSLLMAPRVQSTTVLTARLMTRTEESRPQSASFEGLFQARIASRRLTVSVACKCPARVPYHASISALGYEHDDTHQTINLGGHTQRTSQSGTAATTSGRFVPLDAITQFAHQGQRNMAPIKAPENVCSCRPQNDNLCVLHASPRHACLVRYSIYPR